MKAAAMLSSALNQSIIVLREQMSVEAGAEFKGFEAHLKAGLLRA